MRRQVLPGALALLALAATGAPARAAEAGAALPNPRVRVVLNAMGSFTKASFGDTRNYTEYAETTTIDTSYSTQAGFGPDLALQLRIHGGIGLLVGYSFASRSEAGQFDAQRPNPLYLDRPRSASGELTGYQYREGAVHLDLAYGRTRGALDWSLFAGASLFQVEADLLGQVSWNDPYPYDTLTAASTPAHRTKASPAGFNVGGRLDWRFSRTFGVGLLLRYCKASAKLRATPDAGDAAFDAGGLQAGAGVRLYL
jgi:hypothetical protein